MPTLKFTIRQVAHITEEDLPAVSKTMGAAFKDDSFTRTLLAGDVELIPELWTSIVVAASTGGGEVYVAETADAGIVGVAVWFGPGQGLYDSQEKQETALAGLLEHFSPELQKWWSEYFLPLYEETKARNLGEGGAHMTWQCQTLAVHPDAQRNGIARSFVEIIKKKAAEKGERLFLEAESEINLAVWGKIGFSVVGEPVIFHGLSGEFPMWVMTLDTKV